MAVGVANGVVVIAEVTVGELVAVEVMWWVADGVAVEAADGEGVGDEVAKGVAEVVDVAEWVDRVADAVAEGDGVDVVVSAAEVVGENV